MPPEKNSLLSYYNLSTTLADNKTMAMRPLVNLHAKQKEVCINLYSMPCNKGIKHCYIKKDANCFGLWPGYILASRSFA